MPVGIAAIVEVSLTTSMATEAPMPTEPAFASESAFAWSSSLFVALSVIAPAPAVDRLGRAERRARVVGDDVEAERAGDADLVLVAARPGLAVGDEGVLGELEEIALRRRRALREGNAALGDPVRAVELVQAGREGGRHVHVAGEQEVVAGARARREDRTRREDLHPVAGRVRKQRDERMPLVDPGCERESGRRRERDRGRRAERRGAADVLHRGLVGHGSAATGDAVDLVEQRDRARIRAGAVEAGCGELTAQRVEAGGRRDLEGVQRRDHERDGRTVRGDAGAAGDPVQRVGSRVGAGVAARPGDPDDGELTAGGRERRRGLHGQRSGREVTRRRLVDGRRGRRRVDGGGVGHECAVGRRPTAVGDPRERRRRRAAVLAGAGDAGHRERAARRRESECGCDVQRAGCDVLAGAADRRRRGRRVHRRRRGHGHRRLVRGRALAAVDAGDHAGHVRHAGRGGLVGARTGEPVDGEGAAEREEADGRGNGQRVARAGQGLCTRDRRRRRDRLRQLEVVAVVGLVREGGSGVDRLPFRPVEDLDLVLAVDDHAGLEIDALRADRGVVRRGKVHERDLVDGDAGSDSDRACTCRLAVADGARVRVRGRLDAEEPGRGDVGRVRERGLDVRRDDVDPRGAGDGDGVARAGAVLVGGRRLRLARVLRLRARAVGARALRVRVRDLLVALLVHGRARAVRTRAVARLATRTVRVALGARGARVGLCRRARGAGGGEADGRALELPRVGRVDLVVRNREGERESDHHVARRSVGLRRRARRRRLLRGHADRAGGVERLRAVARDGRRRQHRRQRDRGVGGEHDMFADPVTNNHRVQLAEFAAKHRLPSMFGRKEFVEAGGLISYGAQLDEINRRISVHVDKILKGAKPADVPTELPTKFELLINLKTSKQIGVAIPPNLLARADKVIK